MNLISPHSRFFKQGMLCLPLEGGGTIRRMVEGVHDAADRDRTSVRFLRIPAHAKSRAGTRP